MAYHLLAHFGGIWHLIQGRDWTIASLWKSKRRRPANLEIE